MRQYADLTHLLIPVLMAIIGSCSTGRALAEDFGPAQVILLTDSTADRLLNLVPPPPLDGRVLVAGGDQGKVFAFVLGSDTKDANDNLAARRINEIEGCILEGVTCCNKKTGTFAIDAAYLDDDRFWLSLGQRCEPVEEGAEPGVPFTKMAADIWEDLTKLGVTQPLMTLASENNETRVLVAPWWKESQLLLPRYLGLRTLSPIMPVNHVNPYTNPPGPAAPVGGCVTMPGCRSEDSRRCYADNPHPTGHPEHTKRHHWYVRDILTGRWCETVDRCSC